MPLTILAVGDIMLGEQPLCYNFGVSSIIKKRNIEYLFRGMTSTLNKGDLVFGNLEAPISAHSNQNGIDAQFFRCHPEVAKGLKKANFNVLSVANNHMMDHGRQAFFSTLKYLQDSNIFAVGFFSKFDVVKVGKYTVAFLAYSLLEDKNIEVHNSCVSDSKIIEDVKNVRSKTDLVIVSLHWGSEYIPFPSPMQIEMGRKLVEAGADIILGSHPHVLQGYEIYNGRPIIYSLGNFIFDSTYIANTRKGMIVKFVYTSINDQIEMEAIPFICEKDYYSPIIANGKIKQEIFDHLLKVRKSLENVPTDQYAYSDNAYSKLANKYKRGAKIEMMIHFIKNLHRYPRLLSIKIINEYISNSFIK